MRLPLSVFLLLFGPSSALAAGLVPATIAAFEDHPKRLAAQAKQLQALAGIEREKAALYPRLAFETDGGTKVVGNAPSAQPRALGDSEYIDGIVTADQRLFDFGATASRIQSATRSASASGIAPDISLNELIAQAMALSRRATAIESSAQLIQATAAGLEKERERAEFRFQQGLEGPSESRRLSIRLAELERQLEQGAESLRGLEAQAIEGFSVDLQQLRSLRSLLTNLDLKANSSTLQLRQLDLQRQAKAAAAQAIVAEGYPVISLELKGRLFDIDEAVGDYELTGNLKVTIPFLDGGARAARLQAAEFELRAIEAELDFEERVLNERLSQLDTQARQLSTRNTSLKDQAQTLREQIQALVLRQGKTATGTGELANALLALYENEQNRLNVLADQAALSDERITVMQQWPIYFSQLKDQLTNE